MSTCLSNTDGAAVQHRSSSRGPRRRSCSSPFAPLSAATAHVLLLAGDYCHARRDADNATIPTRRNENVLRNESKSLNQVSLAGVGSASERNVVVRRNRNRNRNRRKKHRSDKESKMSKAQTSSTPQKSRSSKKLVEAESADVADVGGAAAENSVRNRLRRHSRERLSRGVPGGGEETGETTPETDTTGDVSTSTQPAGQISNEPSPEMSISSSLEGSKSSKPSLVPSVVPSVSIPPTSAEAPSSSPSLSAPPSTIPSKTLSVSPSNQPSSSPTALTQAVSPEPSNASSLSPSESPKPSPKDTSAPSTSSMPSNASSSSPSVLPEPSNASSSSPSVSPEPSNASSSSPSESPKPSPKDTSAPSKSSMPSNVSSSSPSVSPEPSKASSSSPSVSPEPSNASSSSPSVSPEPSNASSLSPSESPKPSPKDTSAPSMSSLPSWIPSDSPSLSPTSCLNYENCVQPTEKNFNITLVQLGGITDYDDDFLWAKRRWEEIIVNDLPGFANTDGNINFFSGTGYSYNGAVDDLVVGYRFGEIDGTDGVLGSAGPVLVRQNTRIPASGIMEFDVVDFQSMYPPQTFAARYIISHELGHVLGIGVTGACFEECPVANGEVFEYFCQRAAAEYAKIVKCTASASGPLNLQLENDGGNGTACSHWEDDNFQHPQSSEMMTGFFDSSLNQPISRVTVAALDDLGYEVDYCAADKYPLLDGEGDMLGTASTTNAGAALLRKETEPLRFSLSDGRMRDPKFYYIHEEV